MTDEESTTKITLGEVYRSNVRMSEQLETLTDEVRNQHHELSNSVNTVLGQQAVLANRVSSTDALVSELKNKVDGLMWKAALFSGVGGAVVFVAEMLWKR